MVAIRIIRRVIGFSLKGIGFFWSFGDKFLCSNLCGENCTPSQSNSCSLLFLFAGILFIVSGYVLIVMKDKERKTLKAKVKKAIRSVK